MPFKSICKNPSGALLTIIAMCLGITTGLMMGEKASWLAPLGDIFLNLIFCLIAPLIFLNISSAIANLDNLKSMGKTAKNGIIVFIGMAFIATVFMIIVVKLFPVATGVDVSELSPEVAEKTSLLSKLAATITTQDFYLLLSRKAVLPLIVFSGLFGAAVNIIGEKGEGIKQGLNNLLQVIQKMTNMVMYYAPIGLFAYFASYFGSSAKDLIGSFARSVVIYHVACVVYIVVFYSLFAYFSGGKSAVKSLKHLLTPAVTALATQSSIATLPSNLEAAAKMSIPQKIRSLILPLGAGVHLDGSSMLVVVKIAFLFEIFGTPMTGVSFYLGTIIFGLLAGFFVAGIPGGGMVIEMTVISSFGFPMEAYPMLVMIAYINDAIATVMNAIGDVAALPPITRLTVGSNWQNEQE